MVKKTRFVRCSALISAVLLLAGVLCAPALADSYSLKSRTPSPGFDSTYNRWVVSSSYPSAGDFGSLVNLASSAGFPLYGYESMFNGTNVKEQAVRYTWNVPSEACLYFEYTIAATNWPGTPTSVYGLSGAIYGSSIGEVSGQFDLGTSTIRWTASAYSTSSTLGYTDLTFRPIKIGETDYTYFPIFAPISIGTDVQALQKLEEIKDAIDRQTEAIEGQTSSVTSAIEGQTSAVTSAIEGNTSAIESQTEYLESIDPETSEKIKDQQERYDEISQQTESLLAEVSVPDFPATEYSVPAGLGSPEGAALFGSIGDFVLSIPGVMSVIGIAGGCMVLALVLFGTKG